VQAAFTRLVGLVERRYGAVGEGGVPFALRAASGPAHVFGGGDPAFTVVVNDAHGVAALSTMDRTRIIEAYLAGSLDLDGDVMRVVAMRELFSDRRPAQYLWRFVRPLLFGRVRSDARAIAMHYDIEEDFFLLFLDRRHRCYSQAVFARDDEPLEDAVTRKLDTALDAVGARPGDRVLDIGSGWGAMVEHGGRRGVRVTSLTISARSEAYVRALIDREGLPCEVRREHFLEHAAAEPYDAIVNLGVTEHLPDYAATLRRYAALLKPGGRVYLDASAQRVKHAHSTFMARYVFEGDGSLLCLHEYLAEVARSPFRLEGVWDDRHNYYLTTRAWAERLDAARAEIERRWGAALYRTFQLYLWGSAEGFQSGMIDAYRVVLRLPPSADPRPT
jgi:cyclopropane-fatty-acyl-phospholipid synthase